MKHTILYLAANPLGTDPRALDQECAAIERELRMAPGRDDFEFRSRWAVSVDELMRHLNEMSPAILHFSGQAGLGGAPGTTANSPADARQGAGIFLQDESRSQFVPDRALARIISSASPATRVVVLNAGNSAAIADLLRPVGCVVGVASPLGPDAARSFAVAFYRALGNRRSVGNAVDQGAAALAAKQLDADPVCKVRDGLLADQIFLGPQEATAPAGTRPGSPDGPARAAPRDGEPMPAQAAAARTLRDPLLSRLKGLLPAQFEEVIFRAGIPAGVLPGSGAAQAMRAIEAIQYIEQQNRLPQLAEIVAEVTGLRLS